MFRWLHNFSIGTKILLLALFSAGLALGVTCASLALHEIHSTRENKLRTLTSLAGSLAFNCTAVLTFNDAEGAKQLLASVQADSTIEDAVLYNAQGKIVASYSKSGQADFLPLKELVFEPKHQFLENGFLQLFVPVTDQGESLGTIRIHANMKDLHQHLAEFMWIVAGTVVCTILILFLLASYLQRPISQPILELAQTAALVTQEGDYSIRVEERQDRELGTLYSAFNQMLQQIQVSDLALQLARDELERRVMERTVQLTDEIAQRNLIQVDLEQAKEAADTSNRAKSEFLANMSHEIRTPLNAILGFADLLRRGLADNEADRNDYLNTIHSSGKHLLELINDILDISKIEAGKMTVERIDVSPQQLVAEVVSVLRVRAEEKKLSLDYELAGPIPATIRTDPSRLRQMLINLVGNAIKFTSQGQVRVVMKLLQENEPQLQIEVRDSGIGISNDKLDTIFEPFVQADTSVTRNFGGTGLGLAISRRLAQALGGDLRVESLLNIGSTFSILLPVDNLSEVPLVESRLSDIAVVAKPKSKSTTATLAPARILVVEDGETNRKLVTLLLRRAGCTVESAENGKLGVEAALQAPFDAILMDMQMPVMDGYTAARVLRDKGYTGPIIALTAHAMKGDDVQCIEAGCSGYMTKPIDSDKLIAILSELLVERPLITAHSVDSSDKAEPTSLPATPAQLPPSVSMDPSVFTKPPSVCLQQLVSSLPMEDEEFREIVNEFVERLREKIAEMTEAARNQEFARLAKLAHWLKGSGGTAGFQILTTVGKQLETAAHEEDGEQVAAHLAELSELRDSIVVG